MTRIAPPSDISNSAEALEKSLPKSLTSRSNTPSSRSSAIPTQLTLTAWASSAPSTPPIECVGYFIGGKLAVRFHSAPPLYWYAA